MTCKSKIVVFDLDETLGYFMDLGMFWDALKEYIRYTKTNKIIIDQNLFNNLLDLYPEFLRPNILEILNYLKKKKQNNHCDKLMIYTNNQGPIEWANYIVGYFKKKINYDLFDQIIAAFKVQSKRVELCRTTHRKTHSDLIKCTKIPDDTEICFLDDVFYPDMKNDKIYYINVKPYIHDLDFDEMITRCLDSEILGADVEPKSCRKFILKHLKIYHYTYVHKTKQELNIDNIISKKILQHLHIFFKTKPNKTISFNTLTKTRRKKSKHNKTLKKQHT